MRVVFVENENPNRNSSGGIMTYILNLSAFYRKRGVETILLGIGSHNRPSKSFSNFVPICEKSDISNPMYLFHLFRMLPKLKFIDTAIIHAQRPDMLIPFIILKKSNFLVCTLHGAHDKAVFYKKGVFYGLIYKMLQFIAFKRANVLIAVDRQTKDYYENKYKWAKKKITLIPIAVDIKRFTPGDKLALKAKFHFDLKEKVIIYIGRIEKEKNLTLLLHAYSLVCRKVKDLRLIIIGTGRQKLALKDEIRLLNLNNVSLLGEIKHELISDYLNIADVFALCSHFEASPNVIKEALACNIPVVSVDVGDVRELIEGVDGCYIAKNDAEDFSNKLFEVLNNNKKIDSRGKMLNYSHERIGQETLSLYNLS